MAEVAGEQHEVVSDGHTGPAPAGNQARGERMPKIVEARLIARAIACQPMRQLAEGRVQHAVVKGTSVHADKEFFGERPLALPCDVIAQERAHRRRMERQQAFGAGLGGGHAERAGFGVEIFRTESAGLDDAQSGAGDQPDKCAKGERAQRFGWRQGRRPAQQQSGLLKGVNVRRDPAMRRAKQAWWWNLGARIECGAVAGKPADYLQPFGVIEGGRFRRQGGPGQREGNRERLTRSGPIREPREIQQQPAFDAEGKTKRAPMRQILLGEGDRAWADRRHHDMGHG